MRKVYLRDKEMIKYEVIKKLVETNGNKHNASIKLKCTIRTINRLIKLYKEKGKEGFVHGNRGKLLSTTIPLETRNKIIKLYIDEFSDANFTHFCEIVSEDLNVKISDTTLRNWLYEEGVLSPKARKATRKKLKKELKEKLKLINSKKVQNEIKEAIASIEDPNPHHKRPRCKYMGEMIQMDASSLEWVNGEIWHLHLAVDDATGTVVGAYFDKQETLNDYYNVLKQILIDYGIHAMFYTDRRTVFEYKRKNNAFDDDDTFTQFSYACHNLGIDIKTTSIAQAKGRIERLNQTFQSRLPIELRRKKITTIEAANKFLKHYLKKFNDQFALHLNNTKSVFEKQPTDFEINHTLAVISQRVVDSGNTIRFKNKFYSPLKKDGTPAYLMNKTKCLVIEALDGNLYLNANDVIYGLIEVPSHKKISKEFDKEVKENKPKKIYIPPMSHPWKRASFLNYLQKQKHRDNTGVNV